ncbi:MAG: hypothetical protein ABI836_13710 [Gemmatimonadota bacterium]
MTLVLSEAEGSAEPSLRDERSMTTPERLTAALSDRYTIERELGQGGMATVYLAHDLKHDRQVALKVLRPDLAADRFLAEIKTTANLRHRSSPWSPAATSI